MKKKTQKKTPGTILALDNVFELILLLDEIKKLSSLEGEFDGHLVLIPVLLDDDYFIGKMFQMVYLARSKKGENLRGMFLNEFLPHYWEYKPKLEILDEVWLFHTSGSGPFISRYRSINDNELLESVKHCILEFIEDRKKKLQNFNEFIESLGNNPKKWEKCMICNPIPDKSYAFWKGNELESGGIEPNASLLEIVGAPHFDDGTGYRHWCIKRCPNCKTFYHWIFDYEYLVNGTEDEITLTRLNEKEEKKWLKEVNNILEEKTR
jgi:hypothetical protein